MAYKMISSKMYFEDVEVISGIKKSRILQKDPL